MINLLILLSIVVLKFYCILFLILIHYTVADSGYCMTPVCKLDHLKHSFTLIFSDYILTNK